MFNYVNKMISVCILAAFTAACATNSLRIDYSGNVATAAKNAVVASKEYLREVEESRVDLNLAMIEADAQCMPMNVFLLKEPKIGLINDVSDPPSGWLCSKSVTDETYKFPFSLNQITDEMDPTLLLLASLGEYADALNAIIEREPVDAAKEFNDALALARAAEGLLSQATDGTPLVPAADDERITAVGAFIDMLGKLKEEQGKVDDIRKLLAERDEPAELIETLKEHVALWELARKADANSRATLANSLMSAHLREQPGPSARRSAVAEYYGRMSTLRETAKLEPALQAVLDQLAEAQGNLSRVIVENPKLTDKERAQVARLTRDRLTTAFNALTAIVSAFKGA